MRRELHPQLLPAMLILILTTPLICPMTLLFGEALIYCLTTAIKMNNKLTKLAIIVIILISLPVVALAGWLKINRSSPTFNQTSTPTAKIEKEQTAPSLNKTATVTLVASPTTPTLGQEFTVKIFINSPAEKIVGVNIELKFDPKSLIVVSLDKSPVFDTTIIPNEQNPGFDNQKGSVRLAQIIISKPALDGQIDYGMIKFKAKKTGSTTITLVDEKIEIGREQSGNIYDFTHSQDLTLNIR